MANYKVISRKYRPQLFGDVLGQKAIVTALKNAIRWDRLAHAYLFCGPRGIGKTTLARLFAKALNCTAPTDEGEPCNICSSCREITASSSLDVLEIDGASHRGIEDVRQINETVAYSAASGKYKIYIIDEVHMLTKEAFNALLKTLEEPPPKVKFLFATTEPHKLPATVLSRCQRFNLQRIPQNIITEKLKKICDELEIEAHSDVLSILAKEAEGGFRDAESLLDQAVAFSGKQLTLSGINELLGFMPRKALFTLDEAGHKGNLAAAFTITEELFYGGKDFSHFLEMLMEHIRTILSIKIGGIQAPYITMLEEERQDYLRSASYYTVEQCMTLLDMLIEAHIQLRTSTIPRFALEALLLRLLRSHQRISVEQLVRRLTELETKASHLATPHQVETGEPQQEAPLPPQPPQRPPPKPPTPQPPTPSQPVSKVEELKPQKEQKTQSHYDTLLQFAAVELEGSIQVKKIQT